ncbi:MAG TPA: hypothetical protein VII99_01345 [Bacteroidia bacterium]
MKTYFLFLKTFSLSICVLLFTGCNSAKEEENALPTADFVQAAVKDTGNATKDFFYALPSPIVMAKIFKKTGLKYVDGVANSPDNVSKYTSTQRKNLNLGVYSSDLAYTVLNKQSQLASKYIEAMKKLSDDLGMSTLFNSDDYLLRFKNNLNNEDSLINIVCQLKSDMDVFMKDNDKEKQTLMIFIGAWIENMYIATQLTKEVNKEKVAMRIAEQKYILNSLMDLVANFQNDAEMKDLTMKLGDLKTLFDNLSVQGEDEKVVMDELQLKAITEKTRDLRKEIVG